MTQRLVGGRFQIPRQRGDVVDLEDQRDLVVLCHHLLVTREAVLDAAAKAKAVSIYKDERFSDHAPVTIEYDF